MTKAPRRRLDCVVIGYNETPFPTYERLLRRYGKASAAYRDLQYSFVDVEGEPLSFVDLLNRAERTARARRGLPPAPGEHRSGDIPNLAAVYLVGFLRRRGLAAEYINLFQFEQDRLRALLDEDPACVAITTTFYVTNHPAAEIAAFVKRHRPDIPVVIGGPLVSNHVRRFSGTQLDVALEDLGADVHVVDGQGELTLARVVECLRAGEALDRVPNLILREGGGFRRTEVAPESNSLDENFVDWSSVLAPGAGPTLQTRTARSCAFKCAFCAYPTRAGALTLADIGTVERELDSMMAYGGVENVVFIDDTFNVPLRRFKQLCQRLIDRRYPFRWYSYFRCSNADEEAVDLMARSGCAGVFLGFESGSQRILDGMDKIAKVSQYRDGAEMLQRRGILTFGSFIFGYPGETDETVRETVDFIRALGLDYYRIQMWYCEPGTPIERRRDQHDLRGTGFGWRHRTMDAATAMRHIDAAFHEIQESRWLPQWSFDFWILPYLAGRGVPMDAFKRYMSEAHSLLRLEIEAPAPEQKRAAQAVLLDRMAGEAAAWCRP